MLTGQPFGQVFTCGCKNPTMDASYKLPNGVLVCRECCDILRIVHGVANIEDFSKQWIEAGNKAVNENEWEKLLGSVQLMRRIAFYLHGNLQFTLD